MSAYPEDLEYDVCRILKFYIPQNRKICATVREFMEIFAQDLMEDTEDSREDVFCWLDELTGFEMEAWKIGLMINKIFKAFEKRREAVNDAIV